MVMHSIPQVQSIDVAWDLVFRLRFGPIAVQTNAVVSSFGAQIPAKFSYLKTINGSLASEQDMESNKNS